MINSILVVCIGNICRSPTGERLLKSALPEKNIASAGLGAIVGHAADETASSVADENGVSLQGHVAQQLTSGMCRDYDLILVMEKNMSTRSAASTLPYVAKPCFLDTGSISRKSPTRIRKAAMPLRPCTEYLKTLPRNGSTH